MNEFAVTAENLTKKFDSFIAVNNVNFSVKKGEIFGFLGPNGAGKSTTIRMLCGLLTPTGGKGWVGGYNISTESEQIKKIIGYMSQKFSLYQDLTVEENIRFYSGVYNIKEEKKKERMDWVLSMAGLTDMRKSLTSVLSGGWKQRLALGCAILHEPQILFLDEPTSGVDPVARRDFWELIYDLAARGVTVFVTTHYMDEAEYCDRMSLMYGGKIIALGTSMELKEKYFPYDIYSLDCANPPSILGKLKQMDIIADAALFGHSVHVIVKDKNMTPERLNRAIEEICEIESLEKITPSLEDVFVWLIEKEKSKE
ncbi:MAG: ABC transporter ATP-binding protein [Candidatus Eremiobacterota bacterium]